MSYVIVSDSSSNVHDMHDEHYKTVPLHIMIGGVDWPDTADTDINKFNDALDHAEAGTTSTSCPSHEEHHPDRHVYVIDSLATGPKMILMIQLLERLIADGITSEAAVEKILSYRDHDTALLFTLQSIKRLADNGRVNPLLVKAIGILDLRIIGEASPEGTILIAGKHRGAAKVLKGTYKQMLRLGYNGGKIIISHNQNQTDADALAAMAREQFGQAVEVEIHRTTELCSFYAEKYGYIVGFEIDEKSKQHHLFE